GERDEVGVCDRRAAGPLERPLGARRAEVARLAAEADARPVRRREDRPDPETARLGRLRLLHAVARDVRGVVEPGEQGAVGGREDLGLEEAGLAPDVFECPLGSGGQLGGALHEALSVSAWRSRPSPRPDSPSRASRAGPRRGHGGFASPCDTGYRWPPGTARGGTFSRR